MILSHASGEKAGHTDLSYMEGECQKVLSLKIVFLAGHRLILV